ncbi:Torsin [Drosophila busckii]|uniref:Torsin n=1 Tax=Drosophila busckii TaxID=30019 RepID=A0A0M4FA77_DROBS|nr:torsin-like protein [Drosophila busckii]ALC49600.1 Torsin [Drosophila busckii]
MMTSSDSINYKYLYLLLLISLNDFKPIICIEPLTIGAAVGVGALGYGFLKDQTYCRFYECCDDRSIPGNMLKLSSSLTYTLFGQHLVKDHVIPALVAHLRANNPSRKPLVMSFHGTPGTGKSFVADQIAQALYVEGPKSKYVHKYLGRADFSHPGRINEYKERINTEVRESIKNCPRSMFIFDEVDKMPIGVFDTLTSLVDYAANARDTDYTKAIFIFLSNTAGVHISDHLAALMKKGKRREETRLSDFEEMLRKAAYNLDGGLKKTNMIEAHVIDHYIPFLALEKAHVVQCAEVEFEKWRIHPSQDKINTVVSNAVNFDPVHGMFAISGCKTIEKKVAMLANERN